MSSWGCPHEIDGICQRVKNVRCDPGMKGCVLYGRFTFSNSAKNRPARPETVSKPEEDNEARQSNEP